MDNFIANALAADTDECIVWPWSREEHGYAVRIGRNGKKGSSRLLSRQLCEQAHGPSPTDKPVCAHSCNNGAGGCINPKHLRWATQLENMHDKFAHGTATRGAEIGTSKLTEDDVREIRRVGGRMRQKDIAAHFGVSRANVSIILSGKTWSHVA